MATGYQPPAKEKSCIRTVIFEVIATKTIIDLLYLLIAPEDIILLAYNPLSVNDASYMADIDYILNYISAHCNTKCCSSAMNYPHFPIVLMVGIQSIANLTSHTVKFLREYCHDKTYNKHILQKNRDAFHFINDNRVINPVIFLQEVILATAKPLYNRHCPPAYLQFEKKVLELSRKQNLLNMSKASEIANNVGIERTEHLFEHFRNKGIILYYSNVKVLKNTIYISPKLIITLIIFVFDLSDYPSLQRALAQLRPEYLELLVYLLKSFHLAVAGHWSVYEAAKAVFHFDSIPFIIPSLMNKNAIKEKNTKDCVGVIFHFPDGFLPNGLFYQLMVKLIDWFYTDEDTISG